jgi:hypothetical protein
LRQVNDARGQLRRGPDQIHETATTLQYVRQWIGRHLPQLAASMTALVFHPVLGQLVQAGGDLLVEEFRRLFGRPPVT